MIPLLRIWLNLKIYLDPVSINSKIKILDTMIISYKQSRTHSWDIVLTRIWNRWTDARKTQCLSYNVYSNEKTFFCRVQCNGCWPNLINAECVRLLFFKPAVWRSLWWVPLPTHVCLVDEELAGCESLGPLSTRNGPGTQSGFHLV